jgi:hypothetical protein
VIVRKPDENDKPDDREAKSRDAAQATEAPPAQ